MNYTVLSRNIAIGWSIVIIIGCTLPGPDVPATLTLNDKLTHVAIFVLFGFLWRLAGYRAGWVLLAGLVFGSLIEVAQGILPIHRSADVEDAVADFVGVVIGVGLALGLGRFIKPRGSAGGHSALKNPTGAARSTAVGRP